MLEGIIIWIVFCLGVGYLAKSKGRDFLTYFGLSAVLSPLVGLIVLLVKGKANEVEALREVNHIFYCKNCGDTYSSNGKKTEYCPQCNTPLFETVILQQNWRNYSKEKKDELKVAFSNGQYSITQMADNIQTQPTPAVQNVNSADELKKYKELLDMGAITQEEYDAKKKEILKL